MRKTIALQFHVRIAKIMKKNPFALLFLLFFTVLCSCKKEQANLDQSNKKEVLKATPTGGDQWIQQAAPIFGGNVAPFSLSFSANEKIYVELLSPDQLWQYDPITAVWTFIRAPFVNFTYYGNDLKVAFVNGNNVYFLTNDAKSLKQYNLSTGQWADMATFPGISDGGTTAYTSTKGYIMGGNSDAQNWEYDFSLNSWTMKANVPGPNRGNASSFAVGDKVYFGLGQGFKLIFNPITFKSTSVHTAFSDWWEYNTTSNSWAIKSPFGGGIRWNCRGFAIGGKVYVGMGQSDVAGSNILPDLWSYDPASNSWSQRASYPPGNIADDWTFNLVGNSTLAYAITNDVSTFWLYEPPYSIIVPIPPHIGLGNSIQTP